MEHFEHRNGFDDITGAMPEALSDPELAHHIDFNLLEDEPENIDFVINNANRIFGHDGWSYWIKGEVPFRETSSTLRDGHHIKEGFYIAVVSLFVRGVGTRDGIGTCEIAADDPDSHDAAMYEAVNRALMFAFSTFGPSLLSRPQ